jgi:nitronate monooxygenase
VTSLCQLLGIEVPIVQAPIGHASGPELVAAVCETGALGMLAVTWRKRAQIPQVIGAVRERTARSFGVNLVIERDQNARLDVCLEEGVRVVSFFWGDPARYVERVHQAGGCYTRWAARPRPPAVRRWGRRDSRLPDGATPGLGPGCS